MCEKVDVLVVGGGAAGIVASGRAAEMGKRVVLLEKNERLGMKILISGGGKCNLTHDGSMEQIRAKFRANEALFLKPSFYQFTNHQFLAILHQRGMATYVRPDGRVFPIEPADAKTVVRLLTDYVVEAGVEVRYGAAVTGLKVEDGKIRGALVGDELILAKAVVVAAGGSSYPATGTTGDGWRWLKEIGHTLVPLRAALAPISLVQAKPDWAGVALRNIVLKARIGKTGKEFARFSGDILYTHKGISGPATLGISREVAESIAQGATPYLEADLIPTESFEQLRASLRREATESPKRAVAGIFARFLPARLVPALFDMAGVITDLRSGQLPAKQLTKLVTLLKEWPLGEPSNVPLERGEVVAGGISLAEVDPKTMESREIEGLYLCGEILDIAGPVGGYNLQAAWSTGFAAGTNAARRGN